MSQLSSSHRTPTPAKQDEATQAQASENIQTPVSTYPDHPQDWISRMRLQDRFLDRAKDFTEEERRDAWKVVDEAVKTYSDEMIQRWIVEMDTLLVYAGLFSAVHTAFNVESYSLLPPTTPDPVLSAALTQISAQLASFSVHGPFVNSTQPAFQSSFASSNPTSPQTWAVWLNALWFSSLICSLSAASVAIMVKQWIHEYNSGISGTSRHTARLRQYRYNGLVKWKVASIIAVLPILLQIALGLFLAGLLVLLANLNRTVTAVASTFVGALLAFTLMTIVLPTFSSDCAYLSPLSMSLFRSYRLIYRRLRPFVRRKVDHMLPSGSILQRIRHKLRCDCLGPLPSSIYAMQSVYVLWNRFRLDQDVFMTVYTATMDLGVLEQASTCFSDRSAADLSEFLTRINAQNREFGQPVASRATNLHWTQFIPLDMASDMLLLRTYKPPLYASVQTSGQHMSSLEEMTVEYLDHSQAVHGDHRVSCVLSNMAVVLYNGGNRHPDSFPMCECLWALRQQLNAVKVSNTALPDAVLRRVIAAIYTILRASYAFPLPILHLGLYQHLECLHILMLCSSLSAFRSQRGDVVEEDTAWKPLADAIGLAEDKIIRALQSPQFRNREAGDIRSKFIDMVGLIQQYQAIGLEQLVGRVSGKMLSAWVGAIQDSSGPELYPDEEVMKHRWLEWLLSLATEHDRQIHVRAVDKGEGTRASSSTVKVGQGPRP